jgi:hypothetical protein
MMKDDSSIIENEVFWLFISVIFTGLLLSTFIYLTLL